MAVIVGRPIRVEKIRAGRANPGLRPQHLAGLELISAACGAELSGGTVGSTSIELRPDAAGLEKAIESHISGGAKTAAAVTLMLQTLVPCLLFASLPDREGSISVELEGGTDTTAAPPLDYLRETLLPMLQMHLGLTIELEVIRRGFYPRVRHEEGKLDGR